MLSRLKAAILFSFLFGLIISSSSLFWARGLVSFILLLLLVLLLSSGPYMPNSGEDGSLEHAFHLSLNLSERDYVV